MSHTLTQLFSHRAQRRISVLIALLVWPAISFAQSPLKVPLRSAGNFVIVAATTITSTGGGTINGNIALTPGSAVTGFPPATVTGSIHINDAEARQAQVDLTVAYNDAAGRASTGVLLGNIGGQTLAPGVYKQSSSQLIGPGDLTLDAQGDANAVWIFQIATTLTTSTNVTLKGGAQAKNIFWQVGTSATLGSGTIFYGDILAHVSVTMNSTVQMIGRSLASTGAVTANGTGADNPDSLKTNAPVFTPLFTTPSHIVEVRSHHVDSSGWTLFTIANTGTADLVIDTARSTNARFSSHLASMRIPPGGSIVDSVQFLPTTLGADSAGLIFIHNGASSPDTIIVHGTVVRAIFSTTSRSVNCGITQVGTSTWTLVTLSNTGDDTLRIASAGSSYPDFSSHLSAMSIAPGESITDSIRFLPASSGVTRGALTFVSNAPSSPDTIAVYGNAVSGVNTAIFSTSSTLVDCGVAIVGSPTWRFITITNTGDLGMNIQSASSTNDAFVSHMSAMTIPPGASVIDSIRFVPALPGPQSGKLIFTSNAVNSPDTVDVFGSGTMPASTPDPSTPTLLTLADVHPNPASDEALLRVRLHDGEQLRHAALCDMLGHELQSYTSPALSGGSLALHFGSTPNGRYFILLRTTERTQVVPVTVVR